MMGWIIGSSMRLRFIVIVFAVVLMIFGILQLREMPADLYPEINPPLVEIQTEALGLSAAEVESLITVPTEADLLNGVAWLDQIYSESVAGMSSILLVFEPGTDPIQARQMVQERLTQAFALPNVSKPPTMLQPLSTTSRVMMVGLSSEELSLIDMGVLARWVIQPRLIGVPGVANVAIWGLREWQLQVLVEPERLRDTGVSLNQVIETTGEALWVSPLSYLESSTPGTAGWIDTPNQRLSIRHLLPISGAEDMVQVPVKGTAWRLGDIAEVVEDHQPLIGDAINRDGPGLLLVIEKFPRANTLQVTEGVEEALRAMGPGLSGITIDTSVFRSANYLEQATNHVTSTMMISTFLLILLLGAFFYNWRTALICFVTIPLSLVSAVFVLHLRGETFNQMILAGLVVALSIIIDDAIIDTESIARRFRKLNQGAPEKSLHTIILEASLEMRSPMSFGLMIVVLTGLPILFMQGLTGIFLRPFAITYMLVVLTSLGVALVVTPALSLILLTNAPFKSGPSPLIISLQSSYGRFLARIIHLPRQVYATVIAVVVIGLIALPFLEVSLLPSFKQTDLRIQWEGAPSTSRAEMNRIATQVIDELQMITGVQNVVFHVGRAITGDQVVGINAGELWVSLDPEIDYDTTIDTVREVINGFPGLFSEVDIYQPEKLKEILGGGERETTIRIYGHEFEVLNSKAEEVQQALIGIDGITNIEVESPLLRPQVEIKVDLSKAERFQIKPGDVRRSATTLLSGLHVGSLYEEQKVFDVVVWGAPNIRSSLTDLEELLIDTPRGGHVRLAEVADIRIAPAPIVIQRDAVSRFIDVTAAVNGRALGAVIADIESGIQNISFPLEYHAEVLGNYAERQANQRRTIGLILFAGIGIFLLLQAVYGSFRLAFVQIMTLPMALTGGVLAVFLSGGILSLGSLFGFLSILVLTIRNSIILTMHIDRLERHEGQTFSPELVLQGIQSGFSPILMSNLTTGIAILPLVFAGNIAGFEILHPMSVVILGSLVTTLLLNLLVLPVLNMRYWTSRETVLEFLPTHAAREV